MRGYQIAGAHTDVGKTFVACALLAAARAKGLTTDAFKPVVSGFDPADWSGSDPGRLLASQGRPLTAAALDAVSPLRFAAPLAPPMAARREGQELTMERLRAACRAWLAGGAADLRVFETAGGVASPIAEDGLCLDLMVEIPLPVILVGGTYLGAISHTLTALEALRARGHAVAALVVSESGEPGAPDFDETLASLLRFGSAPTIAARRGQTAWADELV